MSPVEQQRRLDQLMDQWRDAPPEQRAQIEQRMRGLQANLLESMKRLGTVRIMEELQSGPSELRMEDVPTADPEADRDQALVAFNKGEIGIEALETHMNSMRADQLNVPRSELINPLPAKSPATAVGEPSTGSAITPTCEHIAPETVERP